MELRMQKFLQYISEHYEEDISLDRLAGSAHVSKSECLRCFKASVQTTSYQYLIQYRLSQAADLLKNSDESIGNTAERVGFRQISHLGKSFQEKTGFSLRAYRAKLRIHKRMESSKKQKIACLRFLFCPFLIPWHALAPHLAPWYLKGG